LTDKIARRNLKEGSRVGGELELLKGLTS